MTRRTPANVEKGKEARGKGDAARSRERNWGVGGKLCQVPKAQGSWARHEDHTHTASPAGLDARDAKLRWGGQGNAERVVKRGQR